VGSTNAFAQLSNAIAAAVAAASPLLAAIRIGPNRHIAGVLWQHDLVVTSDQALPAHDGHTLVLPGGVLTSAQTARRNASSGLAVLRLEANAGRLQSHFPSKPRVGALALALGADAEAAPMARLAVIGAISTNGSERTVTLDMAGDLVAEGGPVLDASGGLLGMVTIGPGSAASVILYATIQHLVDSVQASIDGRRGWLGVGLQPITVPEPMRSKIAQASGRMVVSLTPSGPAELAGLRPGDILLSLDGHSVSGANALRTLLGSERIGRQVEIRLVRHGRMETYHLTVASQPVD
jgi:serine protease DegQ